MQNLAILLLAAGSSSRMGRPKQLLTFKGSSLINYMLHEVESATDSPIYIVLGAYAEEIRAQLPSPPPHCLINPRWQEGMGSSIAHGIAHLQSYPHFQHCLILLCDQPHIDRHELKVLLALAKRSPERLIYTQYPDTLGVPAIFPRRYFKELVKLSGPKGAKSLIYQHRAQGIAHASTAAVLDLDTPADYENLLREWKSGSQD